jgi:hypothetical protein
LEYSINI